MSYHKVKQVRSTYEDKIFWKDNQVICLEWTAWLRMAKEEILNCPCIDLESQTPKFRYGYFIPDEHGYDWVHIPFNEMPAEFRLQLLLLGIDHEQRLRLLD